MYQAPGTAAAANVNGKPTQEALQQTGTDPALVYLYTNI